MTGRLRKRPHAARPEDERHFPRPPVLPPDIRARKGSAPLVVLTAYSTPVARLVDAHCDIVLVGDSVGMVIHGLPSTLGVTMEMMILHGRAVVRGCQKAMPVIDMPFGSYEESPQQAFRNASRLMAETGAPAVKLEGGQHMAETIAFLTARGVPVMAHVGLTPQSVNTLGGYKVVGREGEADKVMADARAIEAAGAFSVVLEKVPKGLPGGSPRRCRSRPSASARASIATGRCLWSMTCWAFSPTSAPSSSSAMPNLARPPTRPSPPMPPRCGPAASRLPNIPFRLSLPVKK
jgi:hypothetical protein